LTITKEASMNPLASRAVRPAAWVLYVFVVLEFLFMISPVALTFYSAYEPVLSVFHRWEATAWLTGFFLPHFSRTSSPLLNGVRPLGFALALAGLALFGVGAVQIYGAKLLRRGAVAGGLYRWARHPQYLALGVLGLGVALIWARFLVLVMFVTMIFLYLLLSRWEEQLCLDDFGDRYRRVREARGMFLPRSWEAPFRWMGGRLGPWSAGKVAMAYVLSLALALAIAYGLREHTLTHLSSHYRGQLAVLSPALLPEGVLAKAIEVATSDTEIADLLAEEGPPLLAYVVPEGWFLPDLPLHTEEEIRSVGGGHRTPAALESGRYAVLISRTRTYRPGAEGRDIVKRAYAMDPLVIVRVALNRGAIVGVDRPPDHVVWGDIPTPLF
jgi:protein-S-isoprenylcysteine O-methyltransferase Ste14